jgi:hypothetical protein
MGNAHVSILVKNNTVGRASTGCYSHNNVPVPTLMLLRLRRSPKHNMASGVWSIKLTQLTIEHSNT